MYYADPDRNVVELQVDNFHDWAKSSEYMSTSQEFAANPIGVLFDPDRAYDAFQTGKTHEELHRAMMAGHLMPNAPPPLIGLPPGVSLGPPPSQGLKLGSGESDDREARSPRRSARRMIPRGLFRRRSPPRSDRRSRRVNDHELRVSITKPPLEPPIEAHAWASSKDPEVGPCRPRRSFGFLSLGVSPSGATSRPRVPCAQCDSHQTTDSLGTIRQVLSLCEEFQASRIGHRVPQKADSL
jgi:hypothetical protein